MSENRGYLYALYEEDRFTDFPTWTRTYPPKKGKAKKK